MRGMVRRGGRAMTAASLADLTSLLLGDEPAPRTTGERWPAAIPGVATIVGVLAGSIRRLTPAPVRRAAEALARRP